jgi:hypothetical protein
VAEPFDTAGLRTCFEFFFRPRRRPDTVLADGGYDSAAFREWLRCSRITAVIPQRGRKRIIELGRAIR